MKETTFDYQPVVISQTDHQTESPIVHDYAGFWIRVAATLLDSLFLVGLNMLIFNPLRRAFGVSDAFFSIIDLTEIIIDLLYMILLTWWTGQTLGKVILGIRVINARQTRGNLGLGQVFLREVIGKFLSSLPFSLGYMWVGWNQRKQGWHDLLAKTFVIRERRM
ncbi:RDD family protein [Brevibacillus nitrificans]|uniref:RDD family protein n=1 Tax=Brevibacillus nitrificans TaxID=651560 RepID=A0A3M8DGH7_9BACL|nr:RDD family protein [Brevibacillus nitrificans]RNB86651.1 RDD family protein [Brevibacillus nitrificans]